VFYFCATVGKNEIGLAFFDLVGKNEIALTFYF